MRSVSQRAGGGESRQMPAANSPWSLEVNFGTALPQCPDEPIRRPALRVRVNKGKACLLLTRVVPREFSLSSLANTLEGGRFFNCLEMVQSKLLWVTGDVFIFQRYRKISRRKWHKWHRK